MYGIWLINYGKTILCFDLKNFKVFLIDVVLPFYTRNLYPNLVADLQFAILLPDDIKFSQEKRSIKTSMASDRQSSLDFCHFYGL